MMGEALDFGRYAPYVAAAYAASFAVIGVLIIGRRNKLARALKAERRDGTRGERADIEDRDGASQGGDGSGGGGPRNASPSKAAGGSGEG